MLHRFFLILLGLGFTFLYAQDQAPKNWFNLDPKQDGFPGEVLNPYIADCAA